MAKSRSFIFFETSVTLASFVQREVAFSQENDGGIVLFARALGKQSLGVFLMQTLSFSLFCVKEGSTMQRDGEIILSNSHDLPFIFPQ